MIRHRSVLLIIVFIALQVSVFAIWFPPHVMNDSQRYTGMVRYFCDEKGSSFYGCEILRPFSFVFPVAIRKFTTISVEWSIVLTNIVFHLLSVILLYKFILLNHADDSSAFFAALLYAFSPAVLETGFYAVLFDSGSHLFFILPLYVFRKAELEKSATLFYSGCFLLLLSLLYKQSAIIILVWLCVEYFLKKDFRRLISVVLLVGFIYALIQAAISVRFNYDLMDFFRLKNDSYPGYNTVNRFFTYLLLTFNIGWIFFFKGLRTVRKNLPMLRLLSLSFVFMLSWLFHPRFFIFLFPVFYTSCAIGMTGFRPALLKTVLLTCYPVFNAGFYFLLRLYGYDKMRLLILGWKNNIF